MEEIKRFVIHVSTAWCGMDQDYAAYAESEAELYDLADLLAYENFNSFDCLEDVADDVFPDKDIEDLTEEDWDEVNEAADRDGYYYSDIEEYVNEDEDEEDDVYWNELELVYDGRKKVD